MTVTLFIIALAVLAVVAGSISQRSDSIKTLLLAVIMVSGLGIFLVGSGMIPTSYRLDPAENQLFFSAFSEELLVFVVNTNAGRHMSGPGNGDSKFLVSLAINALIMPLLLLVISTLARSQFDNHREVARKRRERSKYGQEI